jgi:hypothetical protein
MKTRSSSPLFPLAESEFLSLDEDLRRVAIAQEVVRQLDRGLVDASTGVYLEFPGDRQTYVNLSSLLRTRRVQACAWGAIFVAAFTLARGHLAERFGIVTYGDALYNFEDVTQGFFPAAELEKIERAFEGYNDRGPESRARRFFRRYPDARDRLRAIMLNIIANEGTRFVPSRNA